MCWYMEKNVMGTTVKQVFAEILDDGHWNLDNKWLSVLIFREPDVYRFHIIAKRWLLWHIPSSRSVMKEQFAVSKENNEISAYLQST